MHLYALTLQNPSHITKAIYGSFSAPKTHELALVKGSRLEIVKPNEKKGRLITSINVNAFGVIRDIVAFRMIGTLQDLIILTSDSGRVMVLEFEPEKNSFKKIHQEPYGKTGCRRIVPGQYIAADPKGRAFMIAAIEKQKFVYILNRDTENNSTISSPLEAHKSHTLTYAICGVDVGHDNPVFAALESDYGETDEKDAPVTTGIAEKTLTFYEMDLGLNHVIRKSAEPVDVTAHTLIPVPGLPDGPSGVIVACEEFLIYRNMEGDERKVAYPKRIGRPSDRGSIINSWAFHRQKDLFFFLLQTELGDLLKLTLNSAGIQIHSLELQYFDTIPLCSSICILRNGFLFGAAEVGNHLYYNFLGIGDEEDDSIVKVVSDSQLQEVEFYPRALTNLALVEEIESLAGITDMKVADLTGEGNPQIYLTCSAGARSSLKMLNYGLSVNEIAASPLPGKVLSIWTLNDDISDSLNKYIILSFLSQTLVLSIGEKVTEVHDSGIELQKATININLLEDSSIVQVTPNYIRHIKRDRKINQWMTESKIVAATSNTKQVAIAQDGGDLIYFELDDIQNLKEVEKVNVESEIICLDIGEVPEGRVRSKFLAVGSLDHTVRIFSLEPDSCLQKLSIQALPSIPDSVCLCEMKGEKREDISEYSQLSLHVGLSNGVMLRSSVDSVTGSLSDTRMKFLGTKSVKLVKVKIDGNSAILATSSRTWVMYYFMDKYELAPLSYDPFETASSFASNQCAEGIVGIVSNSLRIVTLDRLGELFNQKSFPTKFTPRRILVQPASYCLIISETEHRSYNSEDLENVRNQYYKEKPEVLELEESQIGRIKAPYGCWGAGVRLFDPISEETLDYHEFFTNETITCINTIQIQDETLLIVGTVKNLILQPRKFTAAYLHVFGFIENGKKLNYLHSTPLDDYPFGVCGYKGTMLASVGNNFRLYELGKKKFLKKAEMKGLVNGFIKIEVMGDRIFCSDIADSFHILKYKPSEQTFVEVVDDILPRWLTCSAVVDYRTVVGADKYENIFFCRIPASLDEELVEEPYAFKFRWEGNYLNSAPTKMELTASYYVGEVVTSLTKTSLLNTSNEVILYSTVSGSIGALLPFDSKEDMDFFVHLEMYMRIEAEPLAGREHITYRSFYSPVKCVIDGDLCEMFNNLSYTKQRNLSNELDRIPSEVKKKLEDLKNRIL